MYIGLGYFRAKPSPVWIPQQFLNLVVLHLPASEDGTKCSETSEYKIQTPGNYQEENIQQTEDISLFWNFLRGNFDVSLTVHRSITLANDQLDAQIFNIFITIPYTYMFRAISCSSSGGQIVLI